MTTGNGSGGTPGDGARRAAIVGGGIGGLAAAIGLRAAGWDVTVFERAAGLPDTGTGLGMWPSALRALDRLGVGARARALGRPQASGAIRRPDGRRIATLDMQRVRRRHGEPVYLLSRPALLGLLAAALPPGVVRFGHAVDDVGSLGGHHVVVGADGIHSRVRAALFGDAYRLRYTGMTVWRGVADLDTDAGGETWGAGRKFGITPQEPGRTNWYAVIAVPEGYAPPDGDLAELRRRFGRWHDPIPAILDRYLDSGVIRHDIHYLDPPLPRYTGTLAPGGSPPGDGRAVPEEDTALLGDAAHAMAPDLGQGACQALIDGVTLAGCLAAGDVPAGLRAYDRARRRPTQRIAAMATRASRLSQARHLTGLRDAAVRVALAVGTPA